jgi:hypothetical protein
VSTPSISVPILSGRAASVLGRYNLWTGVPSLSHGV